MTVTHIADKSVLAGFFVPMGTDPEGASFDSYDDFVTLLKESITGAGLFEQVSILSAGTR